ncbi:helix-turn-helix domain-containing protein [Paenibacillus shunpengii]|uniref:Helix-turn-helix domain-containing protein n=1 Tax=Paenibacillus shunpengii TaxID=2054424 RepID=A0ABW5SQ37_9BACL|nr:MULTISPECIES: AraC family transcriptional regulator [unclassified Paenibacillus]OMC65425.1 AraC family transcriptional regulator [Paenibacillus sp. FSL H7-0326]SDX19477.1 AraC-type DNA-binding protein [Paenibacillus sp. PDC88]
MKSHLELGFNYNSLDKSFDFLYRSQTYQKDWNIYHIHEGMEFLYVHEGIGQAVIGQKIYDIAPNTLIYFQPYQLHGVRIEATRSTLYSRSILSFEPSVMLSYLHHFHDLRVFFHKLWKSKLPTQVIPLGTERYLEHLFEHYHTHLSSGDSKRSNEPFVMFVLSFLQYAKTIWPNQKQHQPTVHESSHISYIERIMTWIEENYAKEFRLEELGEELHLSRHYVSRLFQSAAGTTITDYLNARRMRQACWLLRNSDLPVYDICHQVGLTNVSYFCKRFREFAGTTPYQYRIGVRDG